MGRREGGESEGDGKGWDDVGDEGEGQGEGDCGGEPFCNNT